MNSEKVNVNVGLDFLWDPSQQEFTIGPEGLTIVPGISGNTLTTTINGVRTNKDLGASFAVANMVFTASIDDVSVISNPVAVSGNSWTITSLTNSQNVDTVTGTLTINSGQIPGRVKRLS